MKKGIIIWIIILIALWAAWSRYYIKNNWEKIVNEDWTIVEYTLKRWKMEWKYKATYQDWRIRERNFKDWIEDWEEILYYQKWKIATKMMRKDWEPDYSVEGVAYYKDWSLKQRVISQWKVIFYYRNWNIKREREDIDDISAIWKTYNERWEKVAEWEFRKWKKYNWTFANDDFYNEDDAEIETIEEYKDWELIGTEEYNK